MKICLVGHSADGLLKSSAGGSERQIALLALELAARGHDVSLVVAGHDGPELTIDGVRVRCGWDTTRGLRWVRALTYRYPHLYRVLRSERAAAYYTRGGGYFTPLVTRAARDVGACSLLALASDRDLYPETGWVLFSVGSARLSRLVGPAAHWAYRRWGLRRATWVLAQNAEQAHSCSSLGLPHAVVPSIVESSTEELAAVEPQRDAIWVGNVFEGRRSKGLGELATLARNLPEVTFTVVGRLTGRSHGATILLLRRLPNVELTGLLAHDDAQRLIADHKLVVNTSPSEGFSNVMLEGWALGRPCVTLCVDPSRLLSEGHLGISCGGSLETMAAALRGLLRDDDERTAMGDLGRVYVTQTHAPDRVCEVFERLIAQRAG
ncbi:MAG TPA: glycosyltransferase family 4 protein [Thermoleophilia bacterium]|nr:glycosyltransferase family 4 protein [Thermoleophilia bacterium]